MLSDQIPQNKKKMGKYLDELRDLKDDGVDYVKLKWAAIRLEMIDKLSVTLSKAFGYSIFLVLLFIAIVFLTVALALWIGEMLGHPSLGFLISGGALLIAALTAWLVGGRFVRNTLVRFLVDIFFPENRDDDGTEEE
jgi:hypothetical protein